MMPAYITPTFITEVLRLFAYAKTIKVKAIAYTALAYFYKVGFYDTHQY